MTSPTKTDISTSSQGSFQSTPEFISFKGYPDEDSKLRIYSKEEKERIEKLKKELQSIDYKKDRELITKLSEDAFNKYIETHSPDKNLWLVFDGTKFIASFRDANEAENASYGCLIPFVRKTTGEKLPKKPLAVFQSRTSLTTDNRWKVKASVGLTTDEQNISQQQYVYAVSSGKYEFSEEYFNNLRNRRVICKEVDFIIDTGANHSILHSDIINDLENLILVVNMMIK